MTEKNPRCSPLGIMLMAVGKFVWLVTWNQTARQADFSYLLMLTLGNLGTFANLSPAAWNRN